MEGTNQEPSNEVEQKVEGQENANQDNKTEHKGGRRNDNRNK